MNAGLQVMGTNQVLEQKIGDRLPFNILQPNCSRDELPIDENATRPRDGMDANKWVNGSDRVFAYETTRQARMVDHVRRRMLDFDSIQEFLHNRGKTPKQRVR